jgi:hypothetical protein
MSMGKIKTIFIPSAIYFLMAWRLLEQPEFILDAPPARVNIEL